MPSFFASSRLRLLPRAQSLRMRQAHFIPYKDECGGSKIVDVWRSLLISHVLTRFATMLDGLESTLPVSAKATGLDVGYRWKITIPCRGTREYSCEGAVEDCYLA